jgi:hypothetical protein
MTNAEALMTSQKIILSFFARHQDSIHHSDLVIRHFIFPCQLITSKP